MTPLRLWTLHPSHLDRQGLVAVWREALLAKAVLRHRTRGYRHHPQLVRFRNHPRPVAAINTYSPRDQWLHGKDAAGEKRPREQLRTRLPRPVTDGLWWWAGQKRANA